MSAQYNKFVRSNVSKLGMDILRSGGLTPIMEAGVMNAIPIWQMLNITEEQYQIDYLLESEYKAFVKSEEAITVLMKEAYDMSLNSIRGDEGYDASFTLVEAQDESK